MLNTAVRVIDSVAVTLVFAIEVAVIVAVVLTEILVGAVYTTEVVVLPLNEPGPVRVQVTPWLFLSLVSVAITVTVCPGLSDCPEAGDSATVMALLPEQPAKTSAQTRIPNANSKTARTFLTVSPQKVVTTSSRNSKPLEREENLQIDPPGS